MFIGVFPPAKPFWPYPRHRQGPIGLIRPGHWRAGTMRRTLHDPRTHVAPRHHTIEEASHGNGRSTHQAGGEVDRGPAHGSPRRRPGEVDRRSVPALRSLAARRRLPVASAGRAGAEEVSDAQIRRVQEQFGASAEAYVSSPLHAAGADLDRLLAWGVARRAQRVLDVATGGGHTALAFAGITRRVVAYDLTEPMLAAARGHVRDRGAANVSFVAGDATALPFAEAAFDVVTCRTAAHHFSDVAAFVRQIHRVLRPGGSLRSEERRVGKECRRRRATTRDSKQQRTAN